MRPFAMLALFPLALAPLARAEALESTEADRRSVAVVVYNENLALVREVRSVKLPAGAQELRFMGVPSAIRPETVSISGKGVGVLEQNYEFDLLSPDKLLEKYVGKEVTVYVRPHESAEERPVRATLLSNNAGLVFRMGDEISLGLPGRVVVPQVPENLIARPTLVWGLDVKEAGARDLEASYLTAQMGWKADYVAVLAEDEKTLDLTGWVTIENKSGAGFEDAAVKLVAGDVNQVRPEPRMRYEMMAAKAAMADEAPAFAERGFFEYHLYALNRKTTLKQNQSKQIQLLAASRIPAVKRYAFESRFIPWAQRPQEKPESVAVKMEFENAARSNLGMPLPKGVVRVYKRDADGAQAFAGEDAVDHTPEGEKVRLALGKAFDVLAERKVTAFREISNEWVEAEVSVTVKNRKDQPVTVLVVERFGGERELLKSDFDARKPDAFTLEFEVPAAAKAEKTLTYSVRARR